eukprot:gene4296-4548_t
MVQQLQQGRRGCKQAELLKAWARGWYGQPSPKQTGNGHGCQCFTPLYDSDDEPTEPNIGVINALAGSKIRQGAAVKVEVADALLARQQHHRQHKQAPVVPLSAAVLHTTAGQQVPLEKLSVVSNIGSKADNLLRPYHHLRMMEEHHQHHQQRRPTQACLPKVVGCSHMVTTRAVGWPAGSTAVSAG